MSLQVNLSSLSAATLSTIADQKTDESVKEDMKLNRSRRATALQNQVEAARNKIELNKDAADERLESAKKKTDGGFWGAIIGIILCVVALVCACTGVGALVAAALIGLAAACLSAGSAVGGLVGGEMAKGNDAKAEQLKTQADNAELTEKTLDKSTEDLKDQIKAAEQQIQSLQQQRAQRLQAQQKLSMGG